MSVKWSPQGLFIYLTMALFLSAAILLKQKPAAGRRTYLVAFFTALLSWIYRGFDTGHPPLQNQFEIFIAMGAMLWPLTQWTRRYAGVDTAAQDATLGFVLLFPAGFVFDGEIRRLMPALQSPLFIPHVGSYLLGYLLLARAALMSAPLLAGNVHTMDGPAREQTTFQAATAGFFLLTTGLILGAVWGKVAWGDYWQWDPKEMWSLATWLIYAGYFHYRRLHGTRHPRILAIWLWVGLVFIALTVTVVNLSRLFQGMHNYA